MEDIS
jgi:hypothetical protein